MTLPEDFASVAINRSDIEPTSEEVDEQISNLLSQHSSTEHITDRAAADGDTVDINYVGSVNNVEFTGGSAENYDLTLGSGTFIDGLKTDHRPQARRDLRRQRHLPRRLQRFHRCQRQCCEAQRPESRLYRDPQLHQ